MMQIKIFYLFFANLTIFSVANILAFFEAVFNIAVGSFETPDKWTTA